MKNITVTVADDVDRTARIHAAERGTSGSALVAEYPAPAVLAGGGVPPPKAQQQPIQRQIQRFRAHDRLTATNCTAVRLVDTNVLLHCRPP